MDAFSWLDDLDGPSEMAKHVGLRLEALRDTTGAGIKGEEHRTKRIEIVARDRRRPRFC